MQLLIDTFSGHPFGKEVIEFLKTRSCNPGVSIEVEEVHAPGTCIIGIKDSKGEFEIFSCAKVWQLKDEAFLSAVEKNSKFIIIKCKQFAKKPDDYIAVILTILSATKMGTFRDARIAPDNKIRVITKETASQALEKQMVRVAVH